MKGQPLCQGEMINKYNKVRKSIDKIKKKILQNLWGNFNQTLHKASLCKGDSKGHTHF